MPELRIVWQMKEKNPSNPEPLDKRITSPQDIEILYLGGLGKMLDKTEIWRG